MIVIWESMNWCKRLFSTMGVLDWAQRPASFFLLCFDRSQRGCTYTMRTPTQGLGFYGFDRRIC